MNKTKATVWLVLFILMFFSWTAVCWSGWQKADIVYQESVSKILQRGDITWGSKADHYYNFGSVVVSADGSKVLFTGKCEFCDPKEVRPFLVNPDGSGLQDLSGMFPADITGRWSDWKNLMINDDGSRVFFRAMVEGGYYDDEYLYVYDVSSAATTYAVNRKFSPLGGWHFRINETGDRVYLDKYDAGWDEALQKHRKGLFYAALGGPINWSLDVDDLFCLSECGNLNMFKLLGTSAKNDHSFFSWKSDYYDADGSNKHTGLYVSDLSGGATLLGDEHYLIYDGDPRGISNTEGTKMIYRYMHEYGHPQELALVDVDYKTSQVVAYTSGLNGFSAHLSRSGRYALVNGEYGDGHGSYYQTLLDLDSGTARDTRSYYMSNWGTASNLTEDDRYYFYSIDKDAEVAGLYRVDTQTTGDDRAPHVDSIEFSAPVLLDQEGSTVAVRVQVTDPQGNGTIEWVRLLPLVEGQEDTPWSMGREPLAFPSADPGSTKLFDDGTHGDQVAGDGIYSFDLIATRKGDRGPDGWNTWYQHYPLPADVGIRVIVKDQDNNYGIADTSLRLSNNPNDVPPPGPTVGGHNAAPATAMDMMAFQPPNLVDPTAVQVQVGACSDVTIQPSLVVPTSDVGKTAQLLMYIYLPAVNLGFNIPGKSKVLSAMTTVDLLPGQLDFSAFPGMNFYVYYGYVIGSTIWYNAYSVTVQPDCSSVPDCAAISDQTGCEATKGCVFEWFPTEACVLDCDRFTTSDACAAAFDGQGCRWNEAFNQCIPR